MKNQVSNQKERNRTWS